MRDRRHRQSSTNPTGAIARRGARRSRRRTGAPAVTSAPSAAALGEVDALLHGLPGLLALVEHPELVPAIVARLDQLDAYAAEIDAELAAGDLDVDALERRSAELIALRDPLWAIRRDRLRTAAAVVDLAGRNAGPERARRLPRRSSRRCRRSTAWRCAAATRPGCTSSCGTTTSIVDDPAVARRRRRAYRRPTVPEVARLGSPGAACPSCTRRRPRSASSATTPGRCAPRSPTTSCCASPCAASGPRSPCSGTPAGPASASSRSPTPTP